MRSRANAKVNFQRRHFECIARIIASFGHLGSRDELAKHFAANLRWTNPNFQADKFIQWANGDERSENDIRADERAKVRVEKAAAKAEKDRIKREQMQPEFTLAELEKAQKSIPPGFMELTFPKAITRK